jgi:hypothetical protein
MSELNESRESFTIDLIKFERNGEKFATITLYDGDIVYDKKDHSHNSQLKHSYCDKEEIIERAYYQAKQAADRKISNIGIPEGDQK